MRETILNKLKQEHRQLEFIIAQIDHCHDIAQKKDLFLELEALLLPHMEGEERTLYAELRQIEADEEALHLASLSLSDHRRLKEIMAQLDQIGIESEKWNLTYSELKVKLLEHIQEEEGELFTEAKEDFSQEELADFADEFTKVKHQLNP